MPSATTLDANLTINEIVASFPETIAVFNKFGLDTETKAIWAGLATVTDPELGLDIVTLGLVYAVELNDGTARITYTLTTPRCPMERVITNGIRSAALRIEGVSRVDTHVVWDPVWHAGMIAPNAFSR